MKLIISRIINLILGVIMMYSVFSLISWNTHWITEDGAVYWILRVLFTVWLIWWLIEYELKI